MTETTRQIIDLRRQGYKCIEIAELLGKTLKSVERACENYGVKKNKPTLPDLWKQDVARLRSERKSYEEISSIVGVPYYLVQRYCNENGIVKPKKEREKKGQSNKEKKECSYAIVELRKQGYSYEQIVEQLNVKMRTVHFACQKYGVAYKDLENKWKEDVADLRRSGNDYTDVSEKLGIDKNRIERYCRQHNLGYEDIGDKPHHSGYQFKKGESRPGYHKGKPFIDWKDRINKKTCGLFEFVNQTIMDNGESRLLIRCTKCGTDKTVSSVTMRHSNIRCTNCFHIETAWKSDRERELDKQEREWRNQVDRGRSLKQMSMNFCRCGVLLPWKAKSCDKCKLETKRNAARRKDYKRRQREKGFDNSISLEKLYKRDRGVCYICNKTCDWSDFQKVNGAFIVGGSYPTVEHVKALCNGGTHTWDNVKLACHSCNSKKGRKEIAG